jgi:uncharacterized protein YlzI (FlbEa/FlbD family)
VADLDSSSALNATVIEEMGMVPVGSIEQLRSGKKHTQRYDPDCDKENNHSSVYDR